MNVNVNGVDGCGVAGSHYGRIYRNDRENVLNESVNVWRRVFSPSLCPRKDEVGPMRRVLYGPTCETDLNGGDDSRNDETWRNRASGRC